MKLWDTVVKNGWYIKSMMERKETEGEKMNRKTDRHLPKIQGGVPGGRFFLTSMFCFIKAAN